MLKNYLITTEKYVKHGADEEKDAYSILCKGQLYLKQKVTNTSQLWLIVNINKCVDDVG